MENPARLCWSLTNSGIGTTISGAGNSGGWSSMNPSLESLFDLRFIDDIGLYVWVGSVASSPSLKVQIDGYDDLGNMIPALAATSAITTAGPAAPVYVGKHGGTAGNFIVLPSWGRVSWTCTGGSCSGVEISIIGR
jgi:hypothetical protein